MTTTDRSLKSASSDVEGEEKHVESVEETQPHTHPADFTQDEIEFMQGFTKEQRKKVIRKVDWRLIPVLAILYLMSHLDRANIGNANIEGLSDDLGLSGTQYNVALCIFFISYILFEVPSNVILKRYFSARPSTWIGIIATSWGLIMTCTGFVKSYPSLVVCRFLLGAAEAGFFPAAVLITSSWYVKTELGTRIALFYTMSALAGAFSGLLAYLIAKMDGTGGYEGWRWIFILEGVASVLAGVSCPFILVDSPARSKWLTEDEARYITLRKIAQDGGRSIQSKAEKMTKKVAVSVFTDWKVYFQGFICFCAAVPSYGLGFTMPQIMKNLGHTSSNAQLMTVPPYFMGAVSALVNCFLADRFQWRMPFILLGQTLILIGFSIICGFATEIKSHVGQCYFAVVIICMGIYPIPPGASAWNSTNLAGPMKRAAGIALMMCVTNCGGIVGSFIYIKSESPAYQTGFGVSLAAAVMGILTTLTLEFGLWKINKKDALVTEEEVREKYTDQELADLGDKSPLFKYTL